MPYYNNRFMGGCMQQRSDLYRPPTLPKPEPCKPQCPDKDTESRRPQCRVDDHRSDRLDSGEWCQDIFKNASGPLAMGGVVWQKSQSPTYDVDEAFIRGTIYKELDKPFLGKGGCRK